MSVIRYAVFEGTVKDGNTEAFRSAILTDVLPHWRTFPGALAVRVCFENERDPGSAEIPLVLAITYPNRAAVDIALASPARAAAKAATEAVLARYFLGHIHHHITEVTEWVA
jgi:hypothetical protein